MEATGEIRGSATPGNAHSAPPIVIAHQANIAQDTLASMITNQIITLMTTITTALGTATMDLEAIITDMEAATTMEAMTLEPVPFGIPEAKRTTIRTTLIIKTPSNFQTRQTIMTSHQTPTFQIGPIFRCSAL